MKESVSKGILGVAFPTLGVIASVSSLEAYLRIASLVVGIAVGVASFVSIVRKHREK